jgi:hypothetical protein
MNRFAAFSVMLCLGVTSFAARPAAAQDASFGCKVLLCAAASSPSWSGISYCVPVMHELFHRLAHGGSWPTCPEGHASGLGYERYKARPAGLTAVAGTLIGEVARSPDGELCADLSKPQRGCTGGDGGCSITYPTTPRERRNDPYFVDIGTANGPQRFYFSLQGY